VVHLAVLGLLVSDEVEVRNCCFSSQFVDEFGLPEEHDVLLVLDCLLHLSSEVVACLLLLDLVDLSEGSSAQALDDLVPFVQNFLTLFHVT